MATQKKLQDRQKKVMIASLKMAGVRVGAKATISTVRKLYTATFNEAPPSLVKMNQKWWYQRNVKLKVKKRKR